jgi:alginate O-acetyltransferase complex protein AlgI
MLFNSLAFVIFFSIVVALYFAIPHRYRWILLLIASYYFYMCWNIKYILLILISTISAYCVALQVEKEKEPSRKKLFLILGVSCNLGILFLFKYFNFFNDSLDAFFNYCNLPYNVPAFNVLLPVGISFYTFQTVGYIIDVYRGESKAEKHLGIFALYVSYFPQLVAGPIERCTRLLPQFLKKHEFDYQRVTDGLKLMAWGMLKKVVIADRLAPLVTKVYNNPSEYQGISFIVATVFFSFQVYCDFSGYSDIAIGAGQVMGIKLMKNFDRPYAARSVSEFWRRWHISLSSWIRDYLFLPIALKKRHWGAWGLLYATMISFSLMGLWHGANWNFLFFGILHGLALSYEIVTRKGRKKIAEVIPRQIYNALSLILTFAFINFTYIFFRANTISDAFYIIAHLFTGVGNFFTHLTTYAISLNIVEIKKTIQSIFYNQSPWPVFSALGLIGFLEAIHFVQRYGSIRQILSMKPTWFRWCVYYAVAIALLFLGKFNTQEFIYFQF